MVHGMQVHSSLGWNVARQEPSHNQGWSTIKVKQGNGNIAGVNGLVAQAL